ncbi:MAG: tetratricopeptide repeat protein [Microthrixaceae bacterium]
MGIARDGDDDRDHEEQALTLLRQLDDPVGLGNLLLNRGFSQFLANRWPDADASWTESAVQYGRAGDVVGGALTDVARAEMLTYQHRLEEAERLLHRSRRILRSAGYPLGVALTASGLSRIELYRGRPGPARELLDEAMTVFEQLGAEDYVLDTRLRIAEWELLAGSPAAAGHPRRDESGDLPDRRPRHPSRDRGATPGASSCSLPIGPPMRVGRSGGRTPSRVAIRSSSRWPWPTSASRRVVTSSNITAAVPRTSSATSAWRPRRRRRVRSRPRVVRRGDAPGPDGVALGVVGRGIALPTTGVALGVVRSTVAGCAGRHFPPPVGTDIT